MIELVELLGQLVAVVGYAARAVVDAGLAHGSLIFVHLLYQFCLLDAQVYVAAECLGHCYALSLGLAQDAAYAGVSVLNERTCVAVEVDRLFWIEQHVLAGINFLFLVLYILIPLMLEQLLLSYYFLQHLM